ncbi:hypothetical protein GCM10009557_91760 [Virgisporangium ochraceum]
MTTRRGSRRPAAARRRSRASSRASSLADLALVAALISVYVVLIGGHDCKIGGERSVRGIPGVARDG